nr:hypothetical protein [Tanacetum cinerariifolium]
AETGRITGAYTRCSRAACRATPARISPNKQPCFVNERAKPRSRLLSSAMLRCLLFALLVALPGALRAQSLRFILRDSTSRQPLIGASVGVPGTGVGGTTDAQVVTATRTNSRIEDQPERIEVLGEEEMQEENGIKPGNIASLLGDIAGTQIQPTSPTTGNADLRIQGLQGQYSQILRDGLPLYGGFAGSFGILSVPPLDLRQIELLKGSNSTLFGGGAIAGLVNLRGTRWGYSGFVGLTRQQAVDVDGDGFVDVPRVRSLNVHPRLFYYPNAHSQLAVGYTGTFESRRGG